MYSNKYHNKKTVYNGVVYDSKKEAKRGYELDLLQRAGKVKDVQRQVSFILQDKYTNNKGEHIRAITYKADFVYFDCDKNMYIVEDCKGLRLETYKIKKKLFEAKYPDYYFIES